MLDATNLLSYAEAAGLLGVTRQTVYNMIRRGELSAVTVGVHRFLLRSDVEMVKEKRLEGGV